MDALNQTSLLEPISILLVDDDRDDRDFFEEVLGNLPISSQFSSIDSEQLTDYLFKNTPPDIIFLDLNMPCKNGLECLKEIKDNKIHQSLPVIICSTSNNETINDELYKIGAHYYLQKTDLSTLKRLLHSILAMMGEKKLIRPSRNKFVLNELH